MKRAIIIFAVFMMTANVWAQSPEKMSYQAVIRDASTLLVTNQTVSMQISILQGSVTGTPVYVETQTPTTNANGLVSIEVGTGNLVSGNFSTIDWGNGIYFIKTETDPTGGVNYTISGTSQLMSVPYALYSKKSADSSTTYQVGDFAHGGVVIYVDETGEHGIVCALSNQSGPVRWFAGTNTYTMTQGNGPYAGEINTAIIIANQGRGDGNTYAARICAEYESTNNGISYGDWYLPSWDELQLMVQNKSIIDATAVANGGTALSGNYWTSNEAIIGTTAYASYVVISNGAGGGTLKSALYNVRAVRSF